MKGIERLHRFRKFRIIGGFSFVIVIVMLTWTGLYYVTAYVSDGLNRDDMREELLDDMRQAVELLEAAGASASAASGGSGAGEAAGEASPAGEDGAARSGQVARLLQAYAHQKGLALALQQAGGDWTVFGEGSDRLAEWMGDDQTAAVVEQADDDGSGAASDVKRYAYRWANPFHTRAAALEAEVRGTGGEAYRFVVGKPLAAWNSHYMYSLAPQLLFMLLLVVVSIISSPWQQQMKALQMMVDAMKRISTGDFTVAISPHRRMGEMTIIAEELSDMALGLKELEETRQRFISDVSHELQSPLTSIGGFARALQNDTLPSETRRDYLGMIEAESKRLSKLSDSLLKLTMLEARRGLNEVQLSEFSLDLQLKRTALAVEPLWLAKRLELDIEVAPVTITGDEDALRQVWTNLLHNAIKFTPERGTIRIGLRQEQGEAIAVVADTGIGIDADDLTHVFERFYKADKARTSAKGGSGLGLSIAATIVRQHGGTIEADSKPGEGTTFTVRLPLQPTAIPTVSASAPSEPTPTKRSLHDRHREEMRQRRRDRRNK